MEELVKNAEEFIGSADDNMEKCRFNAAVSDYFKSIVILCDYMIYREIKTVPKNHSDRFLLLERYFPKIYSEVSKLFRVYQKSYNLRLSKQDAERLKSYSYGLKSSVIGKK